MIIAVHSDFRRNNGENIYQCPNGEKEVNLRIEEKKRVPKV
jgi:hypothetical protein